MRLAGRRALVVGLGKSGVAAARLLATYGAHVAVLTAHLLRAAGKKVFAGGNLGDALSNRVLSGGKLDATVCELSSYQLEGIASLRCAAAAALNVTPDHLDRYPSLTAYAAAKERIFENQKPGDAAVLNLADARVAAMRTPEGVRRRGFD